MFHILQIKTGGFDDNFSYLFWEDTSQKGGIIDPNGSFCRIKEAYSLHCPSSIVFETVFLTHSHKDHWDAMEEAKAFFKITLVAGHPENPHINHPLQDGEKIPFGREFLQVIFTPGHTRDSLSFFTSDGKGLFTGDTLFVDYCGFAQDANALFDSLRNKLFPLPEELMIYSGHDYGRAPFRTLGEEKRANPYLKAETREAFLKVLALLE